jgi:S-adenosylmethionine:tRNA ribosyltransferase-isomerase
VFISSRGEVRAAMASTGSPISYGYLAGEYPLSDFQTVFSEVPGSAEMPSAARPFSAQVLRSLARRGVGLASIVLHTGVSSLEVEEGAPPPLYPEPFEVSAETARAVLSARRDGRRVIAVGTSVVRALESAATAEGVRPMRGFTRTFVRPETGRRVVDGLVTGLHDVHSTHLALLATFLGESVLAETYAEARRRGYLWHEFGDSHLILPS